MNSINKILQTKAQKRFNTIYKLLAQGKSMKAQELADILECTRKTISNDLKPLVESGIVIYKAHYYTMCKEHRMEYKKQQSEMLNSMMRGIVQKIMPHVSDVESPTFFFDFEMEKIEDETTFIEISSALSNKVAINFYYKSRDSKESFKTVYPLKISNFSGAWYLSAYDLEKESLRIYYIQEIKEVTLCEESYLNLSTIQKLESDVKEIDSPWFDTQKQSVILHIKDIAINLIKRKKYHNIEVVQEQENLLIVKMYYYNDIEVLNFVKSWLPYISIYENKALQSELKQILQQALNLL
jgi:predicted DNA-binding transcriptional regulator YafY